MPALDRAARAHVDGHIGSAAPTRPTEAIRELHDEELFDEIIISTLPVDLPKWPVS